MTIAHDTIRLSRILEAGLDAVWGAYADVGRRSRWSVPDGEEMVFDADDLRTGGAARYRCGTPGQLEFTGNIEYVRVVPRETIVHSETVREGSELLSTALLTWSFMTAGASTELTLTLQVTSFVGEGMLEGTRNGHRIALEQLESFLRP